MATIPLVLVVGVPCVLATPFPFRYFLMFSHSGAPLILERPLLPALTSSWSRKGREGHANQLIRSPHARPSGLSQGACTVSLYPPALVPRGGPYPPDTTATASKLCAHRPPSQPADRPRVVLRGPHAPRSWGPQGADFLSDRHPLIRCPHGETYTLKQSSTVWGARS